MMRSTTPVSVDRATMKSSRGISVKTCRVVPFSMALLLAGWGVLAAQIPLSVPKISARPGAALRIPVIVGDLKGKDVSSFGFVIACDTTILRFTGADQKGTLSAGLMMYANNRVGSFGPGKMKVVCASAYPISGSGVLIYLTGVAQKKTGTSALQLSDCLLNAGSPPAISRDGSVKVVALAGTRIANPRDTLMQKNKHNKPT